MTRINKLYVALPPGHPVTSAELRRFGVSADLAAHHVRAGWLTRLARGVFARSDTPLELYPTLRHMERVVAGLHVGSTSALDWHGVRQNVAPRPHLQLYGWESATLPAWFTERFPASYHRLRLFDEAPDAPLRVSRFERHSANPLVSEPERAVLEMLSEVGVRVPVQDARPLVEGAVSLRASVLQELLARCRQVKTVRLCLKLGRELDLPWATKLDAQRLPTGSGRWVGRSKEGLLVLEK